MQKKFDVVTAKKIIAEYADKINFYMKDNQNLLIQVEDLRTTLKINKELLFKYITKQGGDNSNTIFNDLKAENKLLCDKNEQLNKEKIQLERKIQKLNQTFEDSTLSLHEDLEKTKEDIFLLRNKLTEKDSILSLIKRELERMQSMPSNTRKEVYITDPTKANVDLNNELNYTRDIIAKISKMHNVEKVKSDKLENQLFLLQEQLNNLKKNNNDNKSSVVGIAPSPANPNPFMLTNNGNELEDEDILSIEESGDFGVDDNSLSNEGEQDLLESPGGIKFPDKVQMGNSSINAIKQGGINNFNLGLGLNSKHQKSNSLIPKLDLNKIASKYQSENGKTKVSISPLEPNNNANKKINIEDKTKVIEKLKVDLKVSQNSVKELKAKLKKFSEYKTAYGQMKIKIAKLNEVIKNCNSKIESLEVQLKKINGLTTSTGDLSSHKQRYNDNTSMNNNTSIVHEEIDDLSK
jgi:hypothetical protein